MFAFFPSKERVSLHFKANLFSSLFRSSASLRAARLCGGFFFMCEEWHVKHEFCFQFKTLSLACCVCVPAGMDRLELQHQNESELAGLHSTQTNNERSREASSCSSAFLNSHESHTSFSELNDICMETDLICRGCFLLYRWHQHAVLM